MPICKECGRDFRGAGDVCPICRVDIPEVSPLTQGYISESTSEASSLGQIANALQSRHAVGVSSNISKTMLWFAIANIAILLTLLILSVVSDSDIIVLWPFVLALGCVSPLFMLGISKWLAKRTHNMYRIYPGRFDNANEQDLYQLIDVLARRAILVKTPEVWVYSSEDMNAFATGPSRNNAMVAFSSALLRKMDARGLSAIAAHEIAHIANGDMITMTVVQSVVNAISLLITIPIWSIQVMSSCLYGCFGTLAKWVIFILSWIITSIVFVLGLLVVMFCSRQREYAADALAAQLVDRDSMVAALRQLVAEKPIFPVEQRSFTAFKINNVPSWTVLFSTHPPIEDRINRLLQ